MPNVNDVGDRATKWIRWTARIWGFAIMGFALLMPLGYAWHWVTTGVPIPPVGEFNPPIEDLLPIFIFLSALGLGIAWRWERLGGTITIVFQLAAHSLALIHPSTHDFPPSAAPYLVSMIITTPGVLFLVCWWRSKKRVIPQHGA